MKGNKLSTILEKAIKIFREQGFWVVLQKFFEKAKEVILSANLKIFYRVKYGEAAPEPEKVYFLTPERLNQTIKSDWISRHKPFGIVGGNWDKRAKKWRETYFIGLEERFKGGKEWENTEYYRHAVKRLDTGKFPPLEEGHTRDDLESYLEELEEIFEDIKENDYRDNSIVTAVIDRDGNYIVIEGNHRVNMARMLDVEKIPVKVRFRHAEWQRQRMKKSEPGKKNEHPDLHIGGV